MANLPIPKFHIDEIVYLKDNFAHNPAYGVLHVGKVEAIMFYTGKGLFKNEQEYAKGKIRYKISGYNSTVTENELKKIEEIDNG